MIFDYEKTNKIEKLKIKSDKLFTKYPNKIPIIIQFDKSFEFQNTINTKFITPFDLTVAEFQIILRKRCQLNSTEAIFLFFNGDILYPAQHLLKDVYKEKHRKNSGILFCLVMKESVFG